jgi:hypothetical protein
MVSMAVSLAHKLIANQTYVDLLLSHFILSSLIVYNIVLTSDSLGINGEICVYIALALFNLGLN